MSAVTSRRSMSLAFALAFCGVVATTQAQNQALLLDGANDLASIPSAAGLQNPTAFTVEFWFKTNQIGVSKWLVTKGDGGSIFTDRAYDILLAADGRIEALLLFGTAASGEARFLNSSTKKVTANTWHHVALTYASSPGIASIYLDGVLLESQTTLHNPAGAPMAGHTLRQSSQAVRVGTIGPIAGGPNMLGGEVDALRVWNVARTQAQIRGTIDAEITFSSPGLVTSVNFNGNGLDTIGTNHAALLNGATYSATAGWDVPNKAFFTNPGNGAQVPSAASLMNATEMTVEAWVMPTGTSSGYIVEKGDGVACTTARSWELSLSSGVFAFSVFTGPAGPCGWALVQSSTPVTLSTWYHVAGTYSASEGAIRLYVNGLLVAASTTQINSPTPLLGQLVRQSSDPMGIGRHALFTGSVVDAIIDEVRVWTVARTGAAIANNMDATLDNVYGLAASYHMDGNFTDSTGGNNGTSFGGNAGFADVFRTPFRVVASNVAGGGPLSLSLSGVPANVSEGYTLVSFDTSLPTGFGPGLGLNPDALTFAIIAVPAGPGNVFHWTYPVAPALYPTGTLVGASLPVGTTLDFMGVGIVTAPAFDMVVTPVNRFTFN